MHFAPPPLRSPCALRTTAAGTCTGPRQYTRGDSCAARGMLILTISLVPRHATTLRQGSALSRRHLYSRRQRAQERVAAQLTGLRAPGAHDRSIHLAHALVRPQAATIAHYSSDRHTSRLLFTARSSYVRPSCSQRCRSSALSFAHRTLVDPPYRRRRGRADFIDNPRPARARNLAPDQPLL